MSTSQAKRVFSYAERYAVYKCHGPRCCLCGKPLSLVETTIDHFLPERLKHDDSAMQRIRIEWGLPATFAIDSFANWLPAHSSCNQDKGPTELDPLPANQITMKRLLSQADKAKRTAARVDRSRAKDRLFAPLFAALERRELTVHDIADLVNQVSWSGDGSAVPDDVIVLDNGYWVQRGNIVKEGICSCERQACVQHDLKVYCYFTTDLSAWVIETGLYHRCYDEVVPCPRCGMHHRRGYIGRRGSCGRPFADQIAHSD